MSRDRVRCACRTRPLFLHNDANLTQVSESPSGGSTSDRTDSTACHTSTFFCTPCIRCCHSSRIAWQRSASAGVPRSC